LKQVITAYLIDPKTATIRRVTIEAKYPLKEIYALLECSTVDIVSVDANHAIYLDDNGLHDGLECYTMLEGYAPPLAGRLLYLGTDIKGNTASPDETMEAVAQRLHVFRPVLDPVFQTISEPDAFGYRFRKFNIRMEKKKLSIR